jgi:hypothetical protein
MSRILHILLAIVVAAQITGIVHAQSAGSITIQGTVETDSGAAVANALVKVTDINNPGLVDSTLTDLTGAYQLLFNTITGLENDRAVPQSFKLAQNYPNPFANNTNISFSTEKAGSVKLEVFNVLGQKVITLFDQHILPDNYTVSWNGRDFQERQIANGIYFYRLTVDGQVVSKKMLYHNGAVIASPVAVAPRQQTQPVVNELAKQQQQSMLQITVSHPSIVTITDTLEVNGNTTVVANFTAAENLAPIAQLSIEETAPRSFVFDCSNTTDDHNDLAELVFQCDLDGDGISDIPGGANAWQSNPVFTHTFIDDGPWEVQIRAKDRDGAVTDWRYRNINNNVTGYPSDVIPFFSDWKITLGNGSTVNNLINYEHEKYFYNTHDAEDWVVYKTPNSGGTTPNSSNTRSELRQFAEWTPENGGKMTATLSVMHVSTTADARVPASFSVVVGQIHSNEGHKNEPLKIFYKKYPGHTKGSVFWNYEINTNGSNTKRWDYSTAVWGYDWSVLGATPTTFPPEPADGIELGEEFSYEVNVYDGVMYLTFTSPGHETKTFTKSLVASDYINYSDIPQQVLDLFAPLGQDGTEKPNAYAGELQYFKQGCYNQTNGKNPADHMIWNTGAQTYGGDLELQYKHGSFAEVWFKTATVGPGTAP